MIPATKFRELVEAYKRSGGTGAYGHNAQRQLSTFLVSHADALLALVETTDMLKSFMEIGEKP